MDGLLAEGLLRQLLDEQNIKLTYNPELRAWQHAEPEEAAQKGHIEVPGEEPNIVFQTRAHEPTEYENALGDGLEKVLGDGAETLEQLAAGLNACNVRQPDGSDWTKDTLAAELHRLGA